MTITFDIPADIEQNLQSELGDTNAAAKEAVLVELYRQDKITQHQLATALNLTRYETDGVLKRHGVAEDFPTDEELDRAFDHLSGLPKS